MTLRWTAFDKSVAGVAVLLLAAVALVVVLGDRVGVRVLAAGPLGSAHSTSTIYVRFSEDMNRDSVRLRLEPAVDGAFSWNGRMVMFRPAQALAPGAQYTVILERGAVSETGRAVLAEYRFSFTVAAPRVAFLYPADSSPQNIFLVNTATPGAAPQQVTFSPAGVFDFDVSPDGTQIAFAERDPLSDSAEIKVLTLDTGDLRQVTTCHADDAYCTTPKWRSDGAMIAYQRVDLNSDLTSVGISPTRVWLIDLTTDPPSQRPLFSDSQILGYDPRWSADGGRIAVFDNNSQGIVVYDFSDGSLRQIASRYGSVGTLSPDGTRLVFPEMLLDGAQARSYLKLADFPARTIRELTPPGDPVNDTMPVWNPDGRRLAFGRQYLDDRYTRGAQVYVLDTLDGTLTPLLVEGRYANGFFSWDPTGSQLVLQRFPELDASGQPSIAGRPEIWTLDVTTGAQTLLAQNAFFPRWVP